MIISTDCCTSHSSVLMCMLGFSGTSYGADIPVKSTRVPIKTIAHNMGAAHEPLISPARAFLYNPFGSLCSKTCNGASTNTSTNGNDTFSWISRATCRSAWYGDMKAVMEIAHESAKSFETCCTSVSAKAFVRRIMGTHLSDPADVLISRLLVKSQVFIQAKSDVVPIQPISEYFQVEQVLLKSTRDSRLYMGLAKQR